LAPRKGRVRRRIESMGDTNGFPRVLAVSTEGRRGPCDEERFRRMRMMTLTGMEARTRWAQAPRDVGDVGDGGDGDEGRRRWMQIADGGPLPLADRVREHLVEKCG